MKKTQTNMSMNEEETFDNRKMASFTYVFIILFMVLFGYIVFFVINDSDKVLNNPANKRSEIWAKRVTRGKILSSDGKELATTQSGKKGKDTRVYPYGSMFTPVVGRTTHGATGLESSENYELLNSNLNPIDKMVREFNGEKSPGNNVVTTLNYNISRVASDVLGDRRGAVVAMEPKTGKILAMISKPSYDANGLTDEKFKKLTKTSGDGSVLYNRATQGLYPPGSTFKMYTALSFMQQHSDYDSFKYKCTGSTGTGDGSIKCYGGEVHGKVNFEDAFAESCNTAFCNIGTQLNVTKWRELCEDLYFNKPTPIEKIEKNSSRFRLDSSTKKGDVMQASIGQGDVLVTPLQNIFLASAVANDGKLMQPYLVDRIESFDGKTLKSYSPKKLKNVITKSEAKEMNKLMRAVVKRGTASSLYYGTPYKAAGKTGSAQFQSGSSESHAWFVGYAKMDGKCIAVSIVVERGGTGSSAAVPIAKQIFNTYFG
ncbi:MAG: penicillin-binding protein 2 [Eubacterium sp.]|nr:penicillin-binding protein 2 [Eubacterium sp.]